MKLLLAAVITIIALLTWDLLAYNGKYKRAFSGMVGQMATHIH
jgi:hypothetical protein